MAFYYTILKLSPNSFTNDVLSVGILAFNDEKSWLKISENKKNIIKKLVENDSLVDFFLKRINSFHKNIVANSYCPKGFFKYEDFKFSSQYFEYLNRYSNGFIRYSTPVKIEDELNDDKFLRLYYSLIEGESTLERKENNDKVKIQATIDQLLVSKVSDRIHTQVTLTSNNIKSLYFPCKMDCIGLNGVFVGAKSIESTNLIDREVSHYITLISLISNEFRKDPVKNNFFLLFDEPENKTEKSYKVWKQIREVPFFKVIPISEAELVAEKVIETNAKKFLIDDDVF